MQKGEKEQVVAELTERLRATETLIVADYRGLTNAQLEGLRDEMFRLGARFSVVKNTLTRIAAEAAGADALLALLDELRPGARERLTESLRAWLDCQGRVDETARALDVHPQTVRYRLNQLREALGGALDDPDARFELALALRVRGAAARG